MIFEKIRWHLGSSGCPKRNICNLYQPKSHTCASGPYRYCGKYRSIAEARTQEPKTLIQVVES